MSYQINDYDFYGVNRVMEMEVGKRYLASSTDAVSPLHENGGIYPWGSKGTRVPVECLEDHEYFYTVKVLSHWADCANFGKSYPYTVSLMKNEIRSGETKIYETDGDLGCIEDRQTEYSEADSGIGLFAALFSR